MQKEIEKNLKLVKESAHNAALKAGLNPNNVLLVAVSKKKDERSIKAAFDFGIKDFGENYAQELSVKSDFFKDEEIVWHFIGPIQTNKIKLIAKHASWIHSLDRSKVVEKLNKECLQAEKHINALIQINISGEETKSGISPDKLLEFAEYINTQTNINLKGIMILPGINGNTKEKEEEMIEAKKLHTTLVNKFPHASHLSMGTTSDFERAITNGSNIIRVGELIFGKRT
jgi:pyridoxal phosphate enzyme (YggS family)